MSLVTVTPGETTSETLNHLLSLPQLLHPISPSLAALHLARVRLQFAIPATASPAWCIKCGGLRVGVPRSKIASDKRGQSKTSGKGRGKVVAKIDQSGLGCSTCGYTVVKNKRVKPEMPPARQVAYTRRLRSAPVDDNSGHTNVVVDVFGTPVLQPTTIEPTSIAIANFVHPPEATPFVSQALSSDPVPPIISPSKLTTRPSLSYILSTDPNPPTYPLPPPVLRSPSPPRTATRGGAKKKKKSGLAKLLAENKARQDIDKGSGRGSWGL
jgi:hypothetical protein